MLVNWSGKLGHVFGGRIFRILILFLCALGILVGVYRARGNRIEKEQLQKNRPLKHSATNLLQSSASSRWVIVANPGPAGDQFVCSVARVAKDANYSWKTIIIGEKLECCRMPDCYSIHTSQFLRMSYRTASTLKSLMASETELNNNSTTPTSSAYKEVVRNLAYIWVIHRGARHVFDAYVDEYIAAGVSIPQFEEELSRQLHTLALDESLALVEDSKISHHRSRGGGGGSVFRNPYAHFGRPDVRLVPGGTGNNYLERHGHNVPLSAAAGVKQNSSRRASEFPTFRICEVRPPSIEKFLEIDDGWWDLRAPALVLPGDTMPPLCTRNTIYKSDVFWALPILPDYASGNDNVTEEGDVAIFPVKNSTSRIPPWYIRGLWSQSLLGDLGGSIRLTLSRVPTLQLNQNYFTGGDYEPSSSPSTSKLLKRWHCKSRSTFRCLLLMSKELSKSVYLRKHDLALIEAWIIDLKSIHYAEPPMLPKRRSHTNPCLGADGLHGVSFFPALEPHLSSVAESEYSLAKRNETLRSLVSAADKLRVKRDDGLSSDLTPPGERSTYFSTDWSAYIPVTEATSVQRYVSSSSSEDKSSQLSSSNGPVTYYAHFRDAFRELEDSPSDFVRTLVTHSKQKAELAEKHRQQQQNRNGKQFLTQQFPSNPKSSSETSQEEEFPILKAMTENMCTGFGPLIPFKPRKTYDDLLLIVVFSNQHYDLIPTLEVLYRSIFPNMLYCGHPHVSVDLFLRKYQTAEHRSFSFLPTYTRATYECVLGAMEMNYEVKGYIVISDETLMKSWNIEDLDKNKIWVSSSTTHDSRHVPVTKASWRNLDPRGQKLPRLLDGIVNAWKLFTYILVGHDGWSIDQGQGQGKGQGGPITVKNVRERRDVEKENDKDGSSSTDKDKESLETGESSYVPHQIDSHSYSPFGNDSSSDVVAVVESKAENSLKADPPLSFGGGGGWDLSPSDWDNKGSTILSETSNETTTTTETDGDGDVEVGEEDENESASNDDLLTGSSLPSAPSSSPSSSTPEPIMDELESILLPTPLSSELLDSSSSNNSNNNNNSTSNISSSTLSSSLSDGSAGEDQGDLASTTTAGTVTTTGGDSSSVGVPLYHVEHAEPPTPPTWHRPDDEATLRPLENNATSTTTTTTTTTQTTPLQEITKFLNKTVPGGGDEIKQHQPEVIPQRREEEEDVPLSVNYDPLPSITTPPSFPTSSSTRPPTQFLQSTISGHTSADSELVAREMELLLEHVQEVYLNMLHVVSEYKEFNESKSQEFSSEGPSESVLSSTRSSLLEDTKSHRISPREFRHIRCTLQDDGHQSELCSSLRSFISTLGQNLGGEIELDYDTIPMYYLPSWATKSFYSVANVLLHFGVMDELALPLLFRGLATEGDWVNLRRSAALKVISEYEEDSVSPVSSSSSPPNVRSASSLSSSAEEDFPSSPAHYFHPFNLHKVHSDLDKRKLFCSNYLLKVFQM